MDFKQRATEEEKQDNSNLCKACGQWVIDRSESSNSVLCHVCREKAIRFPVPKMLLLFFIIIAVIWGATNLHFPEVLECYRIYENSLVQANTGEIENALDNLNSIIELYPNSIPISIRMIDISMNGGYYDFAGYLINTYIADKKVDEDIAEKLNQYVERINRYYMSYEAIEEMESNLDSELSQEELLSERRDYIQELLNDPVQDKALLYYFLAVNSEDINEMKSNLEKCISIDDTMFDARVQYANILRRQGDFEGAERYLKEVLTENKYDSGAIRGLAIIRLLAGDKEEGLDLAYKAIEINPEGLYIFETYLIALNENKKDSEADAKIQEYLANGSELDEDTQNYLEGKLSLHDYYVDK